MRSLLLVPVVLSALACGGNFSNDDVVFLSALPQREELASAMPGSASNSARLDGTVSALAVGELSKLYADTRRASDDFNRGVDGLLSLLEAIRGMQPTTRAPGKRTWGPFPDRARPGLEVRFQMTREGERFDYELQYRRSGEGEDAWWSLLVGHYEVQPGSDQDLRRGEGSMSVLLREARVRGIELGGLAVLDTLSIGYQTRTQPLVVTEVYDFAEGQPTRQLRYGYRAFKDGPGEMRFVIAGTQLTPGAQLETLDIVSRWTADRGGIARVEVLSGDYTGASVVECWDAAFRTSYRRASWEIFGGEGDFRACPTISAFGTPFSS